MMTNFYFLFSECKDLSGQWRKSDDRTVTFIQDDCIGTISGGLKYILNGVSMTIDNGVTGLLNSAATTITCSDGIIYTLGTFKFHDFVTFLITLLYRLT